MQPVVQEEKTGCGIACVAALAGLSYRQAKEIANQQGVYADDKQLWSESACVRKLLNHLKIKTSETEKPFKNWNKLPNCALLADKWHIENGIPFWHWTVFSRNRETSYVLDPKKALKNNKRTDFGRMRPKWFIEVFL